MPATEENAVARAAPAAPRAGHPDGHKTIVQTPDLEYPVVLHTVVVKDAPAALKWYEGALDAKVVSRYDDADGRVLQAVLKTSYGMMIGVEDHYPKMHMVAPVIDGQSGGEGDAPAKGSSYVYISLPIGLANADGCIERMREAGATVILEPEDKFYGQRLGQVVDPYGVAWAFTHKIDPAKKDADTKAADKEE